MFPNDVWVTDVLTQRLYWVENAMASEENSVEIGAKNCKAILVSQDRVSIWLASFDENKVIQFKKDVSGDGTPKPVATIQVGKQPYAMCEDSKGNIYVANYGDGTVSKISVPKTNSSTSGTIDASPKKIADYNVGAGPRALVADSNDNIYVACSLQIKEDPNNSSKRGGVVYRILDDTTVNSDIVVGLGPCGITCDVNDNIWVTSYAANMVSKISKGVKTLDIKVGAGPIGVVCDSYGNVYVANYMDDTVSFIDPKKVDANGEVVSTPIVVSQDNVAETGPMSIDIDLDDIVYVPITLGSEIKRISGKNVVGTTKIPFVRSKNILNPEGEIPQAVQSLYAIGDFTGCATYNVMNVVQKTDITEELSKFKTETENNIKDLQTEIDELKKSQAAQDTILNDITTNSIPYLRDFIKNTTDIKINILKISDYTSNSKAAKAAVTLAAADVNKTIEFEVVGVKPTKVVVVDSTNENTRYTAIKSGDHFTIIIPAKYVVSSTDTSLNFVVSVDDKETHDITVAKNIDGTKGLTIGTVAVNNKGVSIYTEAISEVVETGFNVKYYKVKFTAPGKIGVGITSNLTSAGDFAGLVSVAGLFSAVEEDASLAVDNYRNFKMFKSTQDFIAGQIIIVGIFDLEA